MRAPTTWHIKYFLLLSAALHVALLIAGHSPEPGARQAGDTLSLALTIISAQEPSTRQASDPQDAQRTPNTTPRAQPSPRSAQDLLTKQARVTKTITSGPSSEDTSYERDADPAVVTTAIPPESIQGILDSRLQSKVKDALAPHFNYPLMARKKGWQGLVKLGVRVETSGDLSNIQVVRSSGYSLLDHAAVKSLKQVARLPGVEGWMEQNSFDMVVPVEYRLTDS